jgi:hypothetical protein
MDQPSLFPPAVRPGDPGTSHRAAGHNRVTLRQRVEDVLRLHPGGVTDWEATQLLGLAERRKPSVAKRRQELGAVDTGRRRPSPDGLMCVVWAIENRPAGTERNEVRVLEPCHPPVAPAGHT